MQNTITAKGNTMDRSGRVRIMCKEKGSRTGGTIVSRGVGNGRETECRGDKGGARWPESEKIS